MFILDVIPEWYPICRHTYFAVEFDQYAQFLCIDSVLSVNNQHTSSSKYIMCKAWEIICSRCTNELIDYIQYQANININ